MHLDSDDQAVVSTTKFVRLPLISGSPPTLGLKGTISRDLREGSGGSVDVPCRVAGVSVAEWADAGKEQCDCLTLRKLRAAFNLLTSALANAADFTGEEYKRRMGEIGEWFAAVKSYADEYVGPAAPATNDDKEVESLVRALRTGLKICQTALMVEEGESEDGHRMRVRATKVSYDVASNQMQNMKHAKCKSSGARSAARSNKQMLQKNMD